MSDDHIKSLERSGELRRHFLDVVKQELGSVWPLAIHHTWSESAVLAFYTTAVEGDLSHAWRKCRTCRCDLGDHEDFSEHLRSTEHV